MIRANAGDRIILFTLVDLLLQIIFFVFLLFAINRASQGKVQDQIAALADKFGIVSVTKFFAATSKLVAISDLGRVDTAATTDRSKILDDATKVIEGLDPDTLKALSGMNKQQLQAFAKLVRQLSPAEREQMTAFIKKYGLTFLRPAVASGLSAEQLQALLDAFVKLPARDRGNLIKLNESFAKADPGKRQKIVDATANVVKPMCFNGQQAMVITEISGGYLVEPNPKVPQAGLGGVRTLTQSEFTAFGSTLNAAHTDCLIRVQQLSKTNSEYQLKTIQQYFVTF
jgi:hypothetical protein